MSLVIRECMFLFLKKEKKWKGGNTYPYLPTLAQTEQGRHLKHELESKSVSAFGPIWPVFLQPFEKVILGVHPAGAIRSIAFKFQFKLTFLKPAPTNLHLVKSEIARKMSVPLNLLFCLRSLNTNSAC